MLLFYWWSQSKRKFRNLAIAAVVGVAVFPLLPDQYVERFKSIGGQEAEGNSKETRIQILGDAWQVLMRNPIGVGIASFPAVRIQMFNRKQDTHNLYLEVATNLGIHGFAVFAYLIYAMFVALAAARNTIRSEQRRLSALLKIPDLPPRFAKLLHAEIDDMRFLNATAQATSGFLIVRLALGMFGMDLYEVYWWFAAGMAFCLLMISSQVKRRVGILVDAVEVQS